MSWFILSRAGFVAILTSFLVAVSHVPASAQLVGGGGVGGGQGGGAGQGGQQGQQGQQGQGNVGGIMVDAKGVVHSVFARDTTGKLDQKRRAELAGRTLAPDLNTSSPLRKVSLVRLEAACDEFAKRNEHVTSEMDYLAGVQRIDYVFVHPETKDLVVAGPAEGFLIDGVGRAVGTGTGRPPLRLDDLMVALRALERGGNIGCSIDPVEANLAQFKSYIARNSNAVSPDLAVERFNTMAQILGMQNVRVFGVPADSHFAETLVEADYRMKRLSMGLEQAPIRTLPSHLSMLGPGANTTQRWWFTPLYNAFVKSQDGLAFQFSGQRVQLLSQDEMVSDAGQRSNAPFTRVGTQRYSKVFTDQYPQLADASPVFAELQSLFDLAVLAALLKKERLPQQVGWNMSLFLDSERATIARRNVPRQVPTAVNYKSTGRKVFIGLVGGGVTINPMQTLNQGEFRGDSDGKLKSARDAGRTEKPPERHPWWWD